MPSGVYERTEKHKEISSRGGLASPTKFRKGHSVPVGIRKKISKTKTNGQPKNVLTNTRRISNREARKIMGLKKYDGLVVHHIDSNIFNNNISNLMTLTPSEHIKLHRAQGDIR